MTTIQHPITYQQISTGEYIKQFNIALRGRFKGKSIYMGHEVNDIVSHATTELCSNVTAVMAKYPCPVTYSALRYRNVIIDYGRRQAVQRGEGARRYRKGISTEIAQMSAEIERSLSRGTSNFTDQADDRRFVDQVLVGLPKFQQRVLRLCAMDGHTTIAAARILGVRRETVSRAFCNSKRYVANNLKEQ